MSASNPQATELWYAALHSPLGIWVTTPDKTRLLQLLYSTRRKLDDPALNRITVKTSPSNPAGEVWLIPLPPASA